MKKRALTLLEIMIVIFLITLITGTIGYSMRGTLDKGRAFRTEQGIEQLRDLLLICVAEGNKAEDVASKPLYYLKKMGLAKDPDKLIHDGWNVPLAITANATKNDFSIESKGLINYRNKTRSHVPQRDDAEEN